MTVSSSLALRLGRTSTQGPQRFRGMKLVALGAVSIFAILYLTGVANARPAPPGPDPRLERLAGEEPTTAPDAIGDARALNVPVPDGSIAPAPAPDDGSGFQIGTVVPYLLVLVALIVVFWLALDWRKPSAI
jgi:hypothetical protein